MNGSTLHHVSKRGTFPRPSEVTSELRVAWSKHPHRLDLTCSNPTRADLDLPLLSACLGREGDDDYRPDPRGLASAREAVCSHLATRAQLAADRVFLTASTSEAYSFLFGTFCNPGDAVLVPHPSYPLLEQLAQLAQIELVRYRIAYDGAWHLDLASLPDRATIEREKIRAAVCVSPNNPTGNFLGERELRSLTALGLPVIVDEVFRNYPHSGTRRDGSEADPLQASGLEAPLVVLDGLSKRLAAPGLKLAWMIALGPGSDELLERLDWYGDTFLSVNSAVQRALPRLFSLEGRVQEVIGRRLVTNLDQAREIATDSLLTLLQSEGGWSVVLRLPAHPDEESAWRLLSEGGVWVQPGQLYGLPFESCAVVSLLTPPTDFRVGLERMRGLLEEFPGGLD